MKHSLGTRLTTALTRQQLVQLRPLVAPCKLSCRLSADNLPPANLIIDCCNPWEKTCYIQVHIIAQEDRIFFPLYDRYLLLGDPRVESQLQRQLTQQLCDGITQRINELEHSTICLQMDLCADRPYIDTTGLVERIERIQRLRATLVVIHSRLIQHLVTT